MNDELGPKSVEMVELGQTVGIVPSQTALLQNPSLPSSAKSITLTPTQDRPPTPVRSRLQGQFPEPVAPVQQWTRKPAGLSAHGLTLGPLFSVLGKAASSH